MIFKRIPFLMLIFFIYFLLNIWNFSVHALVPWDIPNQVFFLDAQNIDGDNNWANEPANNSAISDIIDTFNSFTWSQNISWKQALYKTNSINSFPSLQFDGSDDYYNITDNQTINTATGYTQKSYALILKTGADITTFQTIYEEWGKQKWYSIQIDGWKMYAWAYNSLDWASPNQYKIIDLWSITINTIYTVILIFDSENNFINWYLDWALISTLSTISEQITHWACIFNAGVWCSMYATWSTSIWLGATKNDVLRMSNTTEIEILEWNYFSWNIWEISSWNHALSAVEVTGLQDYFMNKWFPDSIAPTIISTNFWNNAVLPGGNHNIEFNYDDFHEWTSGIDISTDSITLRKWNWVAYWVNIAATGFNLWSKTITLSQAQYPTNNLSSWKYRATFTISDSAWNISAPKILTFYIDIPEFIVSQDGLDIWDIIGWISKMSDQEITLTVKTIWTNFRILLNKNTDLISWPDIITPWDWAKWYWYDTYSYSWSISDIGSWALIANQVATINTSWDKNSYTYKIKIWALVEASQNAWNYSGLIDFTINFDYLSEYSSPTVESSCKNLLDKYGTNIWNWVYTINPWTGNVDVYCDMSVAGWGWTMIKRAWKLGRNGQVSWDRIGVMTEDAQIWNLTDLTPSWTEFSKMSDTQINAISFWEVMIHQDSSWDRIFVLDNIIDSDHLIIQTDLWVYRKWLTWWVQKSTLNSTNNGCSKYWIYITEDTSATLNGWWYRSCAWSMVVSDGWYIHTLDYNGFWLNAWVYVNSIWDEWIR